MSVITTVITVIDPLVKERTLKERDSLDEVTQSFATQIKSSPSTVIRKVCTTPQVAQLHTVQNIKLNLWPRKVPEAD